MRVHLLPFLLGIAGYLGDTAIAQAVSFDCRKASNSAERIICSDDQIGQLDDMMAAAYRTLREQTSNPDALVAAQRAWLADRNACQTKRCLVFQYGNRVAELQSASTQIDLEQLGAASPAPAPAAASPETPSIAVEQTADPSSTATDTTGVEAPAQMQEPDVAAAPGFKTPVADTVDPPQLIDTVASEGPSNVGPPTTTVSDDTKTIIPAESTFVWWRDYLPLAGEKPEDTYNRHPTFYNWLAGYILVSGLFALLLVRPPLMRWYRSQIWLVTGTGPVDILFRQIGFRVGFELFIYAIACLVGSLGGWLFVFLRGRGRPPGAVSPSVAITGNS